MKNLFSVIVLFLFALPSFSQTNSDVNVKVILHPILSLKVNPAQEEVRLEYKTVEDYEDGVTVRQDDHLNIFSTGGFEIHMKAQSANFSPNTQVGFNQNDHEMKAESVKITAVAGTEGSSGINLQSANLSTSATMLAHSSLGTNGSKSIGVEYSGRANNEFFKKAFSKTGPTTYTNVVTYTITAK